MLLCFFIMYSLFLMIYVLFYIFICFYACCSIFLFVLFSFGFYDLCFYRKFDERILPGVPCPVCDSRTTVDYTGTPLEGERNRLGLVAFCSVLLCWAVGKSYARGTL